MAQASVLPRFASVRSLQVRAIDEKRRHAEFVAATEGGVDTWGGLEYLDMDGLKLERYLANPVILDAHRRDECDRVIGSCTVRVEGRLLVVGVTYATTERAERIWKLVAGGFLKAMSVGFFPGQSLEVEAGRTAKLGPAEITGPARIVRDWEPFEISQVPVGADPDALARAIVGGDVAPSVRDALSRILSPEKKELNMADEKKDPKTEAATEAAPAGKAEAARPADALPVALRDLEILKRDALAICPRGLEALADAEVLKKGATLETVRAALLAEVAKRQAPAGSADVDPVMDAADAKSGSAPRVKDVDAGTIMRSL